LKIIYLSAYVSALACGVPGCVGVWMRARAYILAYPACKAYAPYCDVIYGLWLNHIFRHCLINGTIFGKTWSNTKCVSILSTIFF
jgi:hypothetical protein